MEQLKGISCAFHLKSSNSYLSVDFPDPLHEYRICVGVCVWLQFAWNWTKMFTISKKNRCTWCGCSNWNRKHIIVQTHTPMMWQWRRQRLWLVREYGNAQWKCSKRLCNQLRWKVNENMHEHAFSLQIQIILFYWMNAECRAPNDMKGRILNVVFAIDRCDNEGNGYCFLKMITFWMQHIHWNHRTDCILYYHILSV